MTIREEFGEMLRSLRGPYRAGDVATALGRTRQAVNNLEVRAEVSMTRMEWFEDFYGVDFHVVAVDRATGHVWAPWRDLALARRRVRRGGIVDPVAAHGLVRRIEGGAPPALMPDGRRKVAPALAAERPTPAAAARESTGERRSRTG